MAAIHPNILSCVGRTPIVSLSKVARGLPAEVLGKCEYLLPGGSVKDRIAVQMIEEAEKSGRIEPGDTLIEATSGNTGIGMAMAAAVKGYRMIITMPEKMSHEKQVVLEALGAEIHRTPTEAAWDEPNSHIGVARSLQRHIPRSHILDQYGNFDNPKAHYEHTAREILDDLDGRLDAVVIAVGTGGTLTGVARHLKEEIPDVRVIGVDPVGSILAGLPDDKVGAYKVEGIGYDFVPDVLERELVDEWIKSEDGPSFRMARKLIRQEGLLVGGSSGSNVWAACEVAKRMEPGQRVLTFLCDSIRNYLTKFVDDKWMRDNHFLEEDWPLGTTVGDLVRKMPKREVRTIRRGQTIGQAVGIMREEAVSQLPVMSGEGELVGILTETDVLAALFDDKASTETVVAEVMCRDVLTLSLDDDIAQLPAIFAGGAVALVLDDRGRLVSLVSKMDVVEALAGQHKARVQ